MPSLKDLRSLHKATRSPHQNYSGFSYNDRDYSFDAIPEFMELRVGKEIVDCVIGTAQLVLHWGAKGQVGTGLLDLLLHVLDGLKYDPEVGWNSVKSEETGLGALSYCSMLGVPSLGLGLDDRFDTVEVDLVLYQLASATPEFYALPVDLWITFKTTFSQDSNSPGGGGSAQAIYELHTNQVFINLQAAYRSKPLPVYAMLLEGGHFVCLNLNLEDCEYQLAHSGVVNWIDSQDQEFKLALEAFSIELCGIDSTRTLTPCCPMDRRNPQYLRVPKQKGLTDCGPSVLATIAGHYGWIPELSTDGIAEARAFCALLNWGLPLETLSTVMWSAAGDGDTAEELVKYYRGLLNKIVEDNRILSSSTLETKKEFINLAIYAKSQKTKADELEQENGYLQEQLYNKESECESLAADVEILRQRLAEMGDDGNKVFGS
ncbi:hypothetical protein JCM5350_005849 [Sporobolomyces pararoseus]